MPRLENSKRRFCGCCTCLTFLLCYLVKEKQDAESRKIYTVISVIGGVFAAICAVLLFV